MKKIAILVPVCSRNQVYTSIQDIPFLNKLYPSFQKTKDDGYMYTFFIGIDDDDFFYIQNKGVFDNITKHVYILKDCQHAPARAWNKLAEIAYTCPENYDYFFQVGDDITILNNEWTRRFEKKLEQHSNIGVVGPCYLSNYYGRVSNGNPPVIENSFVHRTHIDIFGYYFHPEIMNWFCDDWITRIYDPFFSEIQVDIECNNGILGNRYEIQMCDQIKTYIEEGQSNILRYLKSKV
jgi:hypothetical protein